MKELQNEIHETAKAKGWWDKPREPGTIHMLIVSEIAEATEAARNGLPPIFKDENGKPEGELVELADAVIRIMDYCGCMEWDLEAAIKTKIEYNKTRSHRHGGKAF